MIKTIHVIDNFSDFVGTLKDLSNEEKLLINNNLARYEPNDYYCIVQVESYINYCMCVAECNDFSDDKLAAIFDAFEKLCSLVSDDYYISNKDNHIWG